MSRIMREIRSGTTTVNGHSEMLSTFKAIIAIVLVLTLGSTTWAQLWFTHSVGIGPTFEVSPAVIVPDENGNVKLVLVSSEKDVTYSAMLGNDKIIPTKDGIFKLTSRISGLYTYLTITASTKSDPWDTSVATVLVLSRKVKFDEDSLLSLFMTPNSLCSASASSVKIYVVINSTLGKKEFALYENENLLLAKNLLPFTDQAQVVEYSLKNSNELKSGTYTIKGQLTLVTGEKLTKESTLKVSTCSKPDLSDFSLFPTVVGKEDVKFTSSLKVKSTSDIPIKNVWISEKKATYKDGKWSVVFSYHLPNGQKSGEYSLKIPVKVEDEIGNVFNSTVEKKVCLDKDAPSIESVELVSKNNSQNISEKKSLSIESWSLPIDFEVRVNSTTICGTSPTVKISLDGKNVKSNVISVDKYGTHSLKVTAINPVNGLSTTSNYSLEIKKPLLALPFSWWVVIGIFAAMLISLFLTFY